MPVGPLQQVDSLNGKKVPVVYWRGSLGTSHSISKIRIGGAHLLRYLPVGICIHVIPSILVQILKADIATDSVTNALTRMAEDLKLPIAYC